MREFVILVNELDQELGLMEKMEAHEKGILHRAFSVFIFNKKGQMLLQQRAATKYHSPNLWTNACCSHPRKGEDITAAAKRRLKEEMGMDCTIERQFHFIYKAILDQNMIEHELDHVFTAVTDDLPRLNLNEAKAYRYAYPVDILAEIKTDPTSFTEWFKICLQEVLKTHEI
ncbi:isopentenyl-diphosphate delta-isomerase [Putridiphycobacter roseus]|uniref:Isopentenyl-diphosphate delta-isomerase n=1 Tax=Putridiphycobacter roseus TaxID=2219161 RepID=A0A2W1MUF0_9FLAO|nr:isopentenyl-diphosphate Delta-isomerase [Putridiphycobacter roseus]PZE15689.1 isopentenyl-diphosphate delta-isomerase [Putridiphycobacter roseus]